MQENIYLEQNIILTLIKVSAYDNHVKYSIILKLFFIVY